MADKTTTPDNTTGHPGRTSKQTTSDHAARPQSKGFVLPNPNAQTPSASAAGVPAPSPAAPAAVTTPALATQALSTPVLPSTGVRADTASRDMAIGGGVLLVLVIAFFFAKRGYANLLVSKRVAPRSANAAGWWLFLLLTSLASGGVLAIVDQERFLTPIYIASFLGVALLALILMLVTGRR